MNRTKILVASAIVANAFFLASAHADTGTVIEIPVLPTVIVTGPQSETLPSGIAATTDIVKIQGKGASLIAQRTTALTKLKARIASMKQLTDDQKGTYSAMIDTNMSGLTTLGSVLALETDVAKAKEQMKSILSEYRIFAVFIPKVSILA
jgi:hypothetical protein